MLRKWLLTPTNRPNGMSYKLVLYLVSKVITSPKYLYCSLPALAVHMRFLILVSESARTLNTKYGSLAPIWSKTSIVSLTSSSASSRLICPHKFVRERFVKGRLSTLQKTSNNALHLPNVNVVIPQLFHKVFNEHIYVPL
jgi:hypothetical protein